MVTIRKKRKPDSVELNMISSSARANRLKIQRIAVPIVNPTLLPHATAAAIINDVSTERITEEDNSNAQSDPIDDQSMSQSNDSTHVSKCQAPRSHESREEKAAEAWAELRTELLVSCIEASSHPIRGMLCCICSSDDPPVYCQDCGGYFCIQCTRIVHADTNIFHAPVIWMEDVYVQFPLPPCTLFPRNHQCHTTYCREVTCIGGLGIHRKVKFHFCHCYNEAVTLIKLGFFPATPKRPEVAFQFQLLDLLEALLLECQVAIKDFTNALECLTNCPLLMDIKKDTKYYKALINSFEEYRYLKDSIRHLRIVCKDHSDGTQCPACPRDGMSVPIFAIDGHFGLCRKKSAGRSVRKPLHEGVYFENQDGVNEFVDNYVVGNESTTKECNEFLAGDLLRSKARYKALDETGASSKSNS